MYMSVALRTKLYILTVTEEKRDEGGEKGRKIKENNEMIGFNKDIEIFPTSPFVL